MIRTFWDEKSTKLPVWRIVATSLVELLEVPIDPVNEAMWKYCCDRVHDNEEWLGLPDRDSVVAAVRDGWRPGLDRLRKHLEVLKLPKLPSIRRVKDKGPIGDEVDMQRVYSGNLDTAWHRMRYADLQGRPQSATIVVDIGGNAYTTSDQLFWTGACAVALIEAFRRAYRPCRVIAVDASKRCTTDRLAHHMTEVVVQPMGRSIAMETFAATLCLSGFFRHYGFRSMHTMPRELSSDLGQHWEDYPKPELVGNQEWVVRVDKVWSKAAAQRVLKNFENGGKPDGA